MKRLLYYLTIDMVGTVVACLLFPLGLRIHYAFTRFYLSGIYLVGFIEKLPRVLSYKSVPSHSVLRESLWTSNMNSMQQALPRVRPNYVVNAALHMRRRSAVCPYYISTQPRTRSCGTDIWRASANQ